MQWSRPGRRAGPGGLQREADGQALEGIALAGVLLDDVPLDRGLFATLRVIRIKRTLQHDVRGERHLLDAIFGQAAQECPHRRDLWICLRHLLLPCGYLTSWQ